MLVHQRVHVDTWVKLPLLFAGALGGPQLLYWSCWLAASAVDMGPGTQLSASDGYSLRLECELIQASILFVTFCNCCGSPSSKSHLVKRHQKSLESKYRKYTLWWTNIAMENGHLSWIFPSKMVIFHCFLYVHQRVESTFKRHMRKHVIYPIHIHRSQDASRRISLEASSAFFGAGGRIWPKNIQKYPNNNDKWWK